MQDLTVAEIGQMSRSDAELEIRSRVQTVYLGERQVMARILGRFKIFLSTIDTGFSCHVMLDGYWEMWLTQFFARHVKPGMVVVDVGANFGYYSLLFAEAVGPTGRVLAVEPVASTARFLRRSLDINGHAGRSRVAQCALGSIADGTAHILVPDGEPKNATIVSGPMAGAEPVPCTTLDRLSEDLPRIDLIKIDAEGAERDIVRGMEGIIARHRPSVLLEFNASRYGDAPAFAADLRRLFGSIRALDFDGNLAPLDDAGLLADNAGEDRLLFLEPQP